jgi:hypothetical protein
MVFLFFKWVNIKTFLKDIRVFPIWFADKKTLNPYNTVLILFTCNIIGIICSRGSHRQFYCSFYFTLPFLLDVLENIPMPIKYLLFFSIDTAYLSVGYLNAVTSIGIWATLYPILIFLLSLERQKIYQYEIDDKID